MHTTNTTSADSPATYQTLEHDCGRLSAAARKIATLASAKDRFRDDPAFDKLKAEFNAAFADVHSLAITL